MPSLSPRCHLKLWNGSRDLPEVRVTEFHRARLGPLAEKRQVLMKKTLGAAALGEAQNWSIHHLGRCWCKLKPISSRITAGEKCGTLRRASSITRITIAEMHAVCGDAIDIWCFNRASITPPP